MRPCLARLGVSRQRAFGGLRVRCSHFSVSPVDHAGKRQLETLFSEMANPSDAWRHLVSPHSSYEACVGFLRDMTERGLRPPLLYCSDDCPGLRKALKAVWPKALAQKCQAHKMRNILSKLPRGVQGELKKQIQRVFRAKDYEEGIRRGRALIEQYRDRYPRAMACLAKSLEECLTCLKLPESHRRRVRTTNSLERLTEEGRRRTKVISTIPDERAGLSLAHAVLVDVSRRWHGIRITAGDLEKLTALRAEVAPLAASA